MNNPTHNDIINNIVDISHLIAHQSYQTAHNMLASEEVMKEFADILHGIAYKKFEDIIA